MRPKVVLQILPQLLRQTALSLLLQLLLRPVLPRQLLVPLLLQQVLLVPLQQRVIAPCLTVLRVYRVTTLPVLRRRVQNVAQDSVHQTQQTKHDVSVAKLGTHAHSVRR
jgi:hypothetical protein